MHVGQLRRELDDRLFTRTASGLAFTPGGLRLASRAVEILGLQDRTVREVSQAGHGRRLLRLAASSLFAEHAAPGLIELFAGRADDLDVELSVRPTAQFPALLAGRTVDVAIGPAPQPAARRSGCTSRSSTTRWSPWSGPTIRWPAGPSTAAQAARADLDARPVRRRRRRRGARACCASSAIPESHQRIFQSDAAALEETKRSDGVALAVRFAVADDLAAGRLAPWTGPGCARQGRWAALALPAHSQLPATAELLRFITTPRATQAMVRGSGVTGRALPAVRARHALELTGHVLGTQHVERLQDRRAACVRGQEGVAERQRRRHRADQRLEARRRGPRVEPDHPVRPPPRSAPSPRASCSGSSLSQPSEATTRTPPRSALPCRDVQQLARGWSPGACRRTGRRPAPSPVRSPTVRRVVPQRRGQPGQRRSRRRTSRPARTGRARASGAGTPSRRAASTG